jgi:hypothetical protein
MMGLKFSSGATVEVRVWVAQGIFRPYMLYRVWQSSAAVSGEVIAWDQLVHSNDPHTEALTRKDDKKAERQLRRNTCGDRLKKNGDVLWCTTETLATFDWSLVLQDLRPDKLRNLRDGSAIGPRPCRVEDGVVLAIDVIDNAGATHVTYSNPGYCCPWDECAFASQVLAVVDRIR